MPHPQVYLSMPEAGERPIEMEEWVAEMVLITEDYFCVYYYDGMP